MRVFVTHNPEDLAAYYSEALPELEAIADVVCNPTDHDLDTSELLRHAEGCQVIVAHRATPGPAEVFDNGSELVAVLRCAVDISTIDVGAASRNGVLVARADKSFVPSTAELALGLLIDTARAISSSTATFWQGQMPPQTPGRQLRGQIAGIIGFGAIGTYLAELLLALGMDVLVHDPHVEVTHPRVTAVGFEQLLERSDVVFPLAQAEPATENLIDAAALQRMRVGSTLINVSRGELLDDQAVLDALDAGRLRAVGLDVGRAPDQRPAAALASHPLVVSTPHLGGLTPENAHAQAASSVEQVRAMLDGAMPPRTVNPDDARRLDAWWGGR